jgi:hypothetical protein
LSKIEGPRKLVKRAQFVADYYKIDPVVTLAWSSNEEFCECVQHEDKTYTILVPYFLVGDDYKHKLMEVIAHEMTHVNQYESGRLISLPEEDRHVWLDKKHDRVYFMEDYLLTPWEMEARAMEFPLALLWGERKCRIQKN